MDRKKGVFVRELKNRFLCEIVVDDTIQECYVSSSSHLSNYLNLAGKEVFLREIHSPKSRMRYALQSLALSRGNEIPLEMAISNSVIRKELSRRFFSFLGQRKRFRHEVPIDGYRCDLYIDDSKTIIEIKSILTLEKHAVFPTVYSERAIQQFQKLEALLSKGYNVCYIFASLSSRVEDVLINPEATEFIEMLRLCVGKGMLLHAFALETKNGSTTIKKRIPIIFKQT